MNYIVKNNRIRPSYQISEKIKPSEYLVTRQMETKDGITIKWAQTRLIQATYVDAKIKVRDTRAVFIKNGEEIGIVEFTEIVNKTGNTLSLNRFFDECDAESQELSDMSSRIVIAKSQLLKEKWIWNQESFVEFTLLRMKESHAKASEWAEPTNKLIKKLFKRSSLLILETVPFEYLAYTKDNKRLEPLHVKSFNTRIKAMHKLYGKQLHVKSIGHSTMARALHA